MKSKLLFLAALMSYIGSPLRADNKIEGAISMDESIREDWASKIRTQLWNIVNIPKKKPPLPWNTLAWDVVNYTPNKFGNKNCRALFVLKDDYECLLDKEMKNVKVESNKVNNMSYTSCVRFSNHNFKKFKKNLENAVNRTKTKWNDDYEKQTLYLQNQKKDLDDFIKQLAAVQSRLASPKDNEIKNSDDMITCQQSLLKNLKIQKAKDFNKSYDLKKRILSSVVFNNTLDKVNSLFVSYDIIKNQSYISKNENDLSTYVTNVAKENIVRLVLFVKETIGYGKIDEGAYNVLETISSSSDISRLLALTPEIIQYLKRVSESLGIILENYVVNKQLVDINIDKIRQSVL